MYDDDLSICIFILFIKLIDITNTSLKKSLLEFPLLKLYRSVCKNKSFMV